MTAQLQVLSQQLAKYSREAVEGGNADSFEEFKSTKSQIDALVNALRKGGKVEDNSVPGYEGSVNQAGVSSALKKVTTIWTKMAQDGDRIIKSQDQIVNLSDTAASFTGRIPQISARLDEVVRAMSDAGAPASQINLANRQIVLADRMSRRVTEILAGGDRAVTAADALSRDSVVFGQVLAGLKSGNEEIGVSRHEIEVLGLLSSLYIPPSNFWVQPVVGYVLTNAGLEAGVALQGAKISPVTP